jgi:signal transduction histidine kinase
MRDVETFDKALGAGADDFLTKPIQPQALVVRVRAALEIRRMGSELRENYEIVRRQRDELMRLQLQKERLTDFLVHDLKNPVNSIDLAAQMLLRDRDLSGKSRSRVEQIREETRSLTRLILDLLDISKGEEGQLAPRKAPFDPRVLSDEVFEALRLRATSEQVSLVSEITAGSAYGDAHLLRRVLENLVENAIRHAPAGSEVRLEIHDRGTELEMRVSDSGPGVPADLRERIFERYVQIEREGLSARTGRGLGLSFCKLAVEAHGGRIGLDDAVTGAVFFIRIPKRDET